tara:strand:+ start:54 stop:1001 length:948 start_codon:yes stop_codon:yes gene_type:complete
MEFIKPKIIVSKCLEFEACRYDGQLISNEYIRKLKQFIDFEPICPEVEIGMDIPRDPIRIIKNKHRMQLYQDSTNLYYTNKMTNFSKKFLRSKDNVDGFILKSSSPSCALSTSKIYPHIKTKIPTGKGMGLFASEIIKKFPNHPKEEDRRLNNIFLREHFFTSIFTIADYKNVKTVDSLYKYHAKHKYLFMSYNQTLMRKMGKLAADNKGVPIDKLLNDYYKYLLLMFKKRARYTSNINTQMHVFGYFKKYLTKKEKNYFLNLLEDYRNKKINTGSVNNILYSWIIRFNDGYLKNQSYFNPFPNQLLEVEISRFR